MEDDNTMSKMLPSTAPPVVLRPHKVLEHKHNGQQAIKLTEEPYSGIIFSYGKVEFDVNDDETECKIKFDYDVHDTAGKDVKTEAFHQYLGDFLQELIIWGVQNNDLTYTGGVDENRTGDLSEPDSQ